MSNFTSSTPSFDAGLTAWGNYGGMTRLWGFSAAATTAANGTSDFLSAQRSPNPLVIPTVGSGVAGYALSMADLYCTTACQLYACLEYALGTITLNGNSFSGSASMPTKTILGASITTASSLAFLVVTTAGTATTPTITITYTNQDGTGSQTATITLPTSPNINSAYFLNPHLANGDTGIQTVTNISSSVTTGTMVCKVYGCLVLATAINTAGAGPHGSTEPLVTPTQPTYLCAAGDAVNMYRVGATIANDTYAALAFCPETT